MNDIVRTIFLATLVQDSDLSVGGLDRASSADKPFTIVNGVPLLRGRGLRGSAIAMARRFFAAPLPRCIVEDASTSRGGRAFRDSVWRFSNARTLNANSVVPTVRAHVGIAHKTSTKAEGVLYDVEVIPAGTEWALELHVDWRRALHSEAVLAEGILGYVLAEHWRHGRCWIGGDVARGLGWCHIKKDDFTAHRLTAAQHAEWRSRISHAEASASATRANNLPTRVADLPKPVEIPTASPTGRWCFYTRDITVRFGEYRPTIESNAEQEKAEDAQKGGVASIAWGVDGFSIGTHDLDKNVQPAGDGKWARAPWDSTTLSNKDFIPTDRAILMQGSAPAFSASEVRGAVRHAGSRRMNRLHSLDRVIEPVTDPHAVNGAVRDDDAMAMIYGNTSQSSKLLIRDGISVGDWYAARLHMHAEDEFSASTFGTSKRDAIRLLRGAFEFQVVLEGEDEVSIAPLMAEVDWMVRLGRLGHLPVGGHKTRGAGWGTWSAKPWDKWQVKGVQPANALEKTAGDDARRDSIDSRTSGARREAGASKKTAKLEELVIESESFIMVADRKPFDESVDGKPFDASQATLEGIVERGVLDLTTALKRVPENVAWWCEPAIDFTVQKAPATFGWSVADMPKNLRVDEVMLFASNACWRAAKVGARWQWTMTHEVLLVNEEARSAVEGSQSSVRSATKRSIPARMRDDLRRFSANLHTPVDVYVNEWHADGELVAFTLVRR